MAIFEEERLKLIADYVQTHARASVQELCNMFKVSESTVRRDLTELESRGLLKRTHGGAVYLETVGFEPSYSEKEDQFSSEKKSIARKAAEFIENGDSLLIDSGTTTQYLAYELSRFANLTVVTNSVTLIQKLAAMQNINVVSTGGSLRSNTMAMAGPLAESSLVNLRVDKAFIATNGIDAEIGLTTPSLIEASVKQKMINIADQVYVLADHSKVGKVSFAKFGEISEINACITGKGIDENQRQKMENAGVKLYLVDPDT